MLVLTVGLLLFLGIHSTRIVAEDWRQGQITRRGEKSWKGLYTLVSLASFAMIVWGFGLAQQQPTVLWPAPPTGLKHLASLLTLSCFCADDGRLCAGQWHQSPLGPSYGVER